jgi:hypothetical protein
VNDRLPCTVSGPNTLPPALPGASVPPAMAVLPTVPLPASTAPGFTVVSEDNALQPSTTSVPPLTAVAPV